MTFLETVPRNRNKSCSLQTNRIDFSNAVIKLQQPLSRTNSTNNLLNMTRQCQHALKGDHLDGEKK